MTLFTALVWSIIRSLTLASLAVPVSCMLSRAVPLTQWRGSQNDVDSRVRRDAPVGCWQWCVHRVGIMMSQTPARTMPLLWVVLALLPLFVPELLMGFTYRLTAARLVHSVLATELLYAALLFIKIVAVQVAVYMILPGTSVSRESIQSWKLTRIVSVSSFFGDWQYWWNLSRLWLSGPLRAPLIGWTLSALYCFQEFETAALIQINRHPVAWTVWLFDAHAAGESLVRCVADAGWAMLFQVLLLWPLSGLLKHGTMQDARPFQMSLTEAPMIDGDCEPQTASGFRWVVWLTLAYLGLSVWVVFLWPLTSNIYAAWMGFVGLMNQKVLWPGLQQILWSLLHCGLAASMALLVCIELRRGGFRRVHWLLLWPGLSGALALSLLLLSLFQCPGFHVAYDTWLPMMLGSVLLLLPRAYLLTILLEVLSPETSIHSARLIKGGMSRRILWRLTTVRWLMALGVLTHWSFWDVTVVSILRPVSFEPVVTRLYGEMHWGHTETLVAMTSLSLMVPLLGVGVLLLLTSVTASKWRNRKL